MLPLSRKVSAPSKKKCFVSEGNVLSTQIGTITLFQSKLPFRTVIFVFQYFTYIPGSQNEMHPAITEKYLLTTKSQVMAEFFIRFSKCSGLEYRPVKTGTNPVKPDKIQQPITAVITRRCVTLSAYCRGRSTTAMQRSTDMQPKCRIEVVHNVTSMA